ncbi:hypothetical protein ACWDYH_00485 [Nocardia goodfellowii]
MPSIIEATLKVVGQTHSSNGNTHLRVKDLDSGIEYTIYPTELIELMMGHEFTGSWSVSNKGSSRWTKRLAVRFLGQKGSE